MRSPPSVAAPGLEQLRVTAGRAVRLVDSCHPEPWWTPEDQAAVRRTAFNALSDCIDEVHHHGHGILIVLQGMDASGKDGVVEELLGIPSVCAAARMTRFKHPTADETRHDFLWRIHRHVPARGEVVFFNRSHYEDVIVPRVHGQLDATTWRTRCEHIVAFERLLADERIRVMKFFLHIDRAVQRQRLEERRTGASALHNPADFETAERWDDYMSAYEATIAATTAPVAPWYIIPANEREVRNIFIAAAIVDECRASSA